MKRYRNIEIYSDLVDSLEPPEEVVPELDLGELASKSSGHGKNSINFSDIDDEEFDEEFDEELLDEELDAEDAEIEAEVLADDEGEE